MVVDPYTFCGGPSVPFVDFYVDFGHEDGHGNKILSNMLDDLMTLVEMDPLFGPSTRILTDVSGRRVDGICVAVYQDGHLVRVPSKGGDHSYE